MDLLEIVQKGQYIARILMDSNVSQKDLEMTALNELCDGLLQELGEIEKPIDVKKALMNMFFFGQIMGKFNTR